MKKAYQSFKFSLKKKLLFINAYILLGYIRLILLFIPFKHIAAIWLKPKTFNKPAKLTGTHINNYAIIIGRTVALAAKYTPWESKCLAQSMVCKMLLRKFHVAHTLHIGVNKELGEFSAHAWVTYQDIVINGGAESINTYTVMTQFTDTYTL